MIDFDFSFLAFCCLQFGQAEEEAVEENLNPNLVGGWGGGVFMFYV